MQESERAEDLTGKARIRDAALREFAERGVKGATIRGIAKAAGVSPALVQHHFGTKDALREACDEYVSREIRRVKEESLHGGMANPGFTEIALKTTLPIQRYIARAMTDGSPAATALFDDLVLYSKEVLEAGRPGVSKPTTDDLHAYAVVMTGMSLGTFVLHDHLSRSLGADVLTSQGYPRMALAMIEIFDDRLLSRELVGQARAAMKSMLADGEQSPDEENR